MIETRRLKNVVIFIQTIMVIIFSFFFSNFGKVDLDQYIPTSLSLQHRYFQCNTPTSKILKMYQYEIRDQEIFLRKVLQYFTKPKVSSITVEPLRNVNKIRNVSVQSKCSMSSPKILFKLFFLINLFSGSLKTELYKD